MRFLQHASGSAGNMYEVIGSSGERLIIDCGLSWTKTLECLDHNMDGICGLLIDHAHSDHSKSYEKFTEHGIDVYATECTYQYLPPVKRPRRLKRVMPGKERQIGPFSVTPFSLHHDIENVGFIIKQGGEALCYATDTTHISESWDIPFTTIAIEASWSQQRIDEGLASGKLSSFYTERLKRTHMEVEHCLLYLRNYCNLSRCREIHLIHCSSTLDKESVRARFEKELMIKTIIKE